MKLRFIMLAIIMPLLALATYFAWLKMTVERDRLAVASQSVLWASEQVLINDLVHQLQRERGYSAGFVASGGENFCADLARQRPATDTVVPSALQNTQKLASMRGEAFIARPRPDRRAGDLPRAGQRT